MIELQHGDCLELMNNLEDSSIDMVLTDPPYYKVKGEYWDRQWNRPEDFLKWLGLCVEQWHRILKPNGSLYCFASPQMGAHVELCILKYFSINNHIIWAKQDTKAGGFFRKHNKEGLRKFAPANERILFAEHYGADNIAKGEAGYQTKCDKLRGFVFEPLRAYLDGERKKSGLQDKETRQKMGLSVKGGGLLCHFWGGAQWMLPTEEYYKKLQELFPGYFLREYEDLRREYEDLRREYKDLRREYEDLRRPFNVTEKVPYTDVWTFEPVRTYPGKHPCEKPLDMLYHIIKASTRENAVVLDCFMGTGSTGIACFDLNRQFIGIELDVNYFRIAKERIKERQESLFAPAMA